MTMPSKRTWVDYKEVKAKVSMKMILEHYGLLDQLTRKGDKLLGACPIHKGTNKNQFSVTVSKNAFKCFSGHCGAGGNILDFVAAMDGVDIHEAAVRTADWFSVGSETQKKAPSKAKRSKKGKDTKAEPKGASTGQNKAQGKPAKEGEGNPPLKFELKNLDAEHAYLKERGLTPETIKRFGLGYCSKGMMAGRIAIPIHNEKGELVAYAGRLVNASEISEENPKYKLPPNFVKSKVLFNLHRVKDQAKGRILVVVEGFFDVFKLYQEGIANVVAIMGSSMSEEQEKLILETVGEDGQVELRFDDDEAGGTCAKETFFKLGKRMWIKTK